MEEMVMSESLKKLIAELQDKETNEIHVEALEEVTDFILDHSTDDRKTVGMLNSVRAMRSLMLQIGRAAG